MVFLSLTRLLIKSISFDLLLSPTLSPFLSSALPSQSLNHVIAYFFIPASYSVSPSPLLNLPHSQLSSRFSIITLLLLPPSPSLLFFIFSPPPLLLPHPRPSLYSPFGSTTSYGSVEESLEAFVAAETLDGNNQYFCEKCGKKCDARKGLKFEHFPYVLTMQIKRFDFDYNTLARIKLNERVTFPEILNLNRCVGRGKSLCTFVS